MTIASVGRPALASSIACRSESSPRLLFENRPVSLPMKLIAQAPSRPYASGAGRALQTKSRPSLRFCQLAPEPAGEQIDFGRREQRLLGPRGILGKAGHPVVGVAVEGVVRRIADHPHQPV